MKVIVVPHDPAWKQEFEKEARLIRPAFGEIFAAVHHIGSTSIPDICAKPIIDMLVEVTQIEMVDKRNTELEKLGYECMGEFGISGRRYFRKANQKGVRTHQIHAFEAKSPEVIRHLAFRDYMLAHKEDANNYSELKLNLAQAFPNDIESYINGKDAFIKGIDEKAAQWLRGKVS